jgi:hypothetical protein
MKANFELQDFEQFVNELLVVSTKSPDGMLTFRLPNAVGRIELSDWHTSLTYPDFLLPLDRWVFTTFAVAYLHEAKRKDWQKIYQWAASLTEPKYDVWVEEERGVVTLGFACPLEGLTKNNWQVLMFEACDAAEKVSRDIQRAFGVPSPTEFHAWIDAQQKPQK